MEKKSGLADFWRNDIYPRLSPMLALLDTRYMPVLFSATWQSYTIYLYLWMHSDHSETAHLFSQMGGLAFESIYVGAIAWAYMGQSNAWSRMTAFVALVFSVAIAVYMHRSEGMAAWLQSGFSIATYCYTMQMHNARAPWWVTWLFGDDEQSTKPVATATPSAIESPQPIALPIAPPAPAALPKAQPAIKPSAAPSEPVAVAPAADSNLLPGWLTIEDGAPQEEEPDTSKLHLSKRVPAILKNRPDISNAELYALLPGENHSSIRKYVGDWRKEQLATSHNGNGHHR